MALCSLPRSNPGNRKEYKRVNGPFTLYMVAGGGNKLPYGNLPRLLLAWVCSEAVRGDFEAPVLTVHRFEYLSRSRPTNTSAGMRTRRAATLHESGRYPGIGTGADITPTIPQTSNYHQNCR